MDGEKESGIYWYKIKSIIIAKMIVRNRKVAYWIKTCKVNARTINWVDYYYPQEQKTWSIKCFGCRNIFFLILIDIWYYSFLNKYIYYPDIINIIKKKKNKRQTLHHVSCGTASFGLLYLKPTPPLFTLFLYLLSLYSSLFQFFQYPRFFLTSKYSIPSLYF